MKTCVKVYNFTLCTKEQQLFRRSIFLTAALPSAASMSVTQRDMPAWNSGIRVAGFGLSFHDCIDHVDLGVKREYYSNVAAPHAARDSIANW